MKVVDKLMMADTSGEEGMAKVMVDREMILMEGMHMNMMRVVVDKEMNVKQQGRVVVGKRRQRVVEDGNNELN
jgi:hypothetical protein